MIEQPHKEGNEGQHVFIGRFLKEQ